jgi:hypothetical protein
MTSKIIILLSFLFLCKPAKAQYDSLLCKPNENTVYAFQLQNNKWVTVSKEKNGKYLVYRFGNKDKIELQVPAVLDTSSWSRFLFSGYNRGGGKENAAIHFGYLSFRNKETVYEVYELWNSEDDIEHCGLTIMIDDKKPVKLDGVLKSRHGNLLDLLYEDKVKKATEEKAEDN